MGMTMWVQMQLNPQQPDPVQQKIFNWMPVIFTFMLASFPSGLVIYWAWNNVLSLLQQYTIMRKNNTEVHLWKNLGVGQVEGAAGGGEGSRRRSKLKGHDRQRVEQAAAVRGQGARSAATARTRSATTRACAQRSRRTRRAHAMTREQALQHAGPGAGRDREARSTRPWPRGAKRRQDGLNGSDHAIAARIDAAREILRGKEGA